MRTVLLLLLSLVLREAPVAAQVRAAGPWRVVSQPVRYKLHENWGSVAEWGEEPSPAAKADTTTAVRVQRKLYQVPWNVHPDSITLFLDCQNPLLAPAAPRGQLAPVRFEATGATVRLDAKQRLLLLVPLDSVVVLRAYRREKLVFRHEFKAVPPPLPIIKCYLGGCIEANDAPPGEKLVRTLTLRAIPEVDFATILPEDARYRVARFRTTLLRQGNIVELATGQAAELIQQGPQGNLSNLASISRLGDQLQTDVLMVQRMNFCGYIMEVPVTRRFVTDGLKCPEP